MEQGAKSKAIQIAIIAPARLSRPVTAGKCQEGKVSLRANIGTGSAQPALQPAAPPPALPPSAVPQSRPYLNRQPYRNFSTQLSRRRLPSAAARPAHAL